MRRSLRNIWLLEAPHCVPATYDLRCALGDDCDSVRQRGGRAGYRINFALAGASLPFKFSNNIVSTKTFLLRDAHIICRAGRRGRSAGNIADAHANRARRGNPRVPGERDARIGRGTDRDGHGDVVAPVTLTVPEVHDPVASALPPMLEVVAASGN